jgi:hypothetical protein
MKLNIYKKINIKLIRGITLDYYKIKNRWYRIESCENMLVRFNYRW